jgi:hypothetical protein
MRERIDQRVAFGVGQIAGDACVRRGRRSAERARNRKASGEGGYTKTQ